ncbi:MAG: hypothetical protein HQL31_11095, partial [Planctomycetes bacterium]|nr:hypothetical protein [Planctomycetota bacterium]
YSPNTDGRPFSSMLTCIPSTSYALHHMAELDAVWFGTPSLVVNLNVSWMKYAPLWILERIPEVYDLAEAKGAPPEVMDRWREHNLSGAFHFLEQLIENDPIGNAEFISLRRFIRRHRQLPGFRSRLKHFKKLVVTARTKNHPIGQEDLSCLFECIDA